MVSAPSIPKIRGSIAPWTVCSPLWVICDAITSSGSRYRKTQGVSGNARRNRGSARVCQLSSLRKRPPPSLCGRRPSAAAMARRPAAAASVFWPPNSCTIASSGEASETTTLAGTAASICATRVEPQRDMWKTRPSGAGWLRASGPARNWLSGMRMRNSRLNGRETARWTDSS